MYGYFCAAHRSCLNLAARDKKYGFFVQKRGNFEGIAPLLLRNLLVLERKRHLLSLVS
jgi:hypothetical protein